MKKIICLLFVLTFNFVFSDTQAPYSKIRPELFLDSSVMRTTSIDTEEFYKWNAGRVQWISDPVTLYTYSSEGVDDTDWGCAWRAIQTSLSSSLTEVPGFVFLYENYGDRTFLEETAQELYFIDEEWAAPHESWHMWADPFVGQMIMHHLGMETELIALNGTVDSQSPKVHQGIIDFQMFKQKVSEHFQNGGYPLVIDNGLYAMNILGVGQNGSGFFLLIGDPHLIKDRDDHLLNGLYLIELDNVGELVSIDYPADYNHFDQGSYLSLQRFGFSNWMILFSKRQ